MSDKSKCIQNGKSTFFGDFYVKEEEMLFSNVA